eukprot:7386486-Prymnesium_polylepis.3
MRATPTSQRARTARMAPCTPVPSTTASAANRATRSTWPTRRVSSTRTRCAGSAAAWSVSLDARRNRSESRWSIVGARLVKCSLQSPLVSRLACRLPTVRRQGRSRTKILQPSCDGANLVRVLQGRSTAAVTTSSASVAARPSGPSTGPST